LRHACPRVTLNNPMFRARRTAVGPLGHMRETRPHALRLRGHALRLRDHILSGRSYMLCDEYPIVRAVSPMHTSRGHVLRAMYPIVRRMYLAMGQSDPPVSLIYPTLSLISPIVTLNAPKLGLMM
jgi:hypothetical protein